MNLAVTSLITLIQSPFVWLKSKMNYEFEAIIKKLEYFKWSSIELLLVWLCSYIYLDYFVSKIILSKILNNLRRKYVLFSSIKKCIFRSVNNTLPRRRIRGWQNTPSWEFYGLHQCWHYRMPTGNLRAAFRPIMKMTSIKFIDEV